MEDNLHFVFVLRTCTFLTLYENVNRRALSITHVYVLASGSAYDIVASDHLA